MSGTYDKAVLRAKADEYSQNSGISVIRQLGFGTQGMVFLTSQNSALKVHNRIEGYTRERDVYRRLVDRNLGSLQGFAIPRILSWDDTLLAFEMSVVHVPCILDFGGAYLDNVPPHVLRDSDWLEAKAEEFGANWEKAQSIIRELEFRAGICLSDVNTGNIRFED